MKVLIDADMPAHEIGHIMDGDTGELLEWGKMKELAIGRFWSIFHKSEAGGFEAFVSGGHNFRHDVATIQPYKGNREGAERHCADAIKKLYIDEFNALDCVEHEADDAMAMRMWQHYDYLSDKHEGDEYMIARHMDLVIASRDKDMKTVPGWHWIWPLKGQKNPLPFFQTMEKALRFFYGQLLTGDAVDNIKGLYNVGEKSIWVKDLDYMVTEEEMHEHVMDKYIKYFGAWAKKVFTETGQLLHLWRQPDDVWLPYDERDDDYYNIRDDSDLPF